MKKLKKILIISIFLISIEINCFARYYENLEKIQTKAPIIRIDKLEDTINLELNKKTEPKEYFFIIKNYEIDELNNKRISEVDFNYNIEIINSDNKFPVKYELYDCTTGEKVETKNQYNIEKKKEYEKKYKLVVSWNNLQSEMSNTSDIDIVVNVSQTNK